MQNEAKSIKELFCNDKAAEYITRNRRKREELIYRHTVCIRLRLGRPMRTDVPWPAE